MTLELRDGRVLDAAAGRARGRQLPALRPACDRRAASTGASATRATPGRPTRSRPSGTSRCSSLGTGLTMCDVALALRDADHRGAIVAISRRGLLPAAAPRLAEAAAAPRSAVERWATWDPTALGLLRGLRDEVRRGAARRDRLARGRHVDPPRHARRSGGGSTTTSDAASSVICARTGRRTATARRPRPRSRSRRWSQRARCGCSRAASSATRRRRRGVTVTLRDAAAGGERLEVGKVINCTGPNTNLAEVRDPLVRSLRDARHDPAGCARARARHGRGRTARSTRTGAPSERLSLAGPLRKGLALGAHGGARAARRGASGSPRRLCG